MMDRFRRCLAMPVLAGLLCTAPVGAESRDPADWPFPEDIPQPASATPGLAGETPIDIVRFLLTRGADAPELSPDGKSLVFSSNVTGLPQLWQVSARGGWPRQLTFGPAVTLHRWLPDGSGLLYAADREGDEREAYWFISVDGKRERQILGFDGAFRVFGSFNDDGSRIVYSSSLRNGIDFDIYVADVATGESQLVHKGRFGYFTDSWQPGGSLVLVREIRGEDGNDLHLLDVDSGQIRTLFAPEVHAYYGDFAWRRDGSGFYLVTNHEREHLAVAHYFLATGELEIVEEANGWDIDGVALSPCGLHLVWTVNEGGWSRLKARDLSTGRPLAVPELPRGVYSIRFAHAALVLAIRVSGPDEPGAVWTWNLETQQLAEAAPSQLAGIPRQSLVAPQILSFPARDGVMLHGLLYLPTAGGDRQPPLLMLVHGGPTAQARPYFNAVTQYLVGRGIAVLDLNFRGSTGYGKTFARLDNQRLRPNAVRDLVDALDFLRADRRVDVDRAAVMGRSYGGYLVNDVMGRYPEAFAAGVSFVGVSDWVRALESAPPALQASDRIEYGDIKNPDVREFFRDLSPLSRVERIIAPMLFQHGANDPRDPVTESDRMVLALRERGVEVDYLRHPDEGHSVRRLENRIDLYRRVVAFLERHLGVE